MAIVRQCDRCKKIYEKNVLYDKLNEVTIREYDYLTGERFDLCDECITDFLNFIFNNYQVIPRSYYACSCLSKVNVPEIPILKMNKTSDGAQ